ncbi:hypothetical protein CPB84DRAFT_1768999 [Gymnopilus junonius]|uniref:C2 domain-containing protein n=1 Tax=Gymnopilus junonius TaxID=109634 RepID=A0A9P5NX55_GYMJU|nr:hypothetical protein CPB84DRAFT_1768999 [Gymnopilus junonius]
MKEEGDFAHVEVALAYRAKEIARGRFKDRSTNIHLLMEFWVAGSMKFPVWVDVTGFLATLRVRFQLTPNPPFLSTMVLTFLGLPKVDLKCTPLAKGFLNVMDVPGLSGWIQRSIDAAMQEYVAPRSLTLDLKTMLMGREKMDTDSFGVIIITLRKAEGFRNGDGPDIIKAKAKDPRKGDAYVTVGWGKWSKPLWSTRIIPVGEPIWEETGALLVGPTEVNAQERLRLQLWDADRITADDLLGNVEVDLQEIMTSKESRNCMSVRTASLVDEKGKDWPGTLQYEYGFFAKTTFEQHLANKSQNAEEIRTKISKEAEDKLREAKARERTEEAEADQVERQKKEDTRERTEEIVAGTSPIAEWPSGILSIQIEQVTGLEIQKIRQSGVKDDAGDEAEEDDLPSAYCTIIINHQRVYKTRTKMKSNNPFYNAGTEKFIRDWTTTDVMIAVRDSRIHESDPVIGVLILPLPQILKFRSHFTESLPLVGGIGYGRMRLSLTFRSVQLKLPKRLRGWDVGTLEISSYVTPSSDLPSEYDHCRLVFKVPYGKGKMIPDGQDEKAPHKRVWVPKHQKLMRLPIKKRYATCLLILLRRRVVGPDLTPAFSTLWLKDIPDGEEITLSLPVRRNEGSVLSQAQVNASVDIGERVGTLELKVRLWPGLSGYHHDMADHDKNMAGVMEALDCAEGEQDASEELLNDEGYAGGDSSSSSSDSDKEHGVNQEGSDKDEGPSGVVGTIKNFRKRTGELHRRHRGLMQWKAARNMAWIIRSAENRVEELGEKAKGLVTHHDREIGIEKEA